VLEFPSEQTRFFSAATDVRDRSQADNLEWIVRQEGSFGKVLIYASRFHLSATPVKTAWSLPPGSGQTVAGIYLRRRHGAKLVTIGNLIRCGAYSEDGLEQTLEPAPAESVDALAGEVGAPLFLLDLRTAPATVAHWLDKEHVIGSGQNTFRLDMWQAFDVLFHVDTVSPAAPK
jgi:erythromycin esterase-like protein